MPLDVASHKLQSQYIRPIIVQLIFIKKKTKTKPKSKTIPARQFQPPNRRLSRTPIKFRGDCFLNWNDFEIRPNWLDCEARARFLRLWTFFVQHFPVAKLNNQHWPVSILINVSSCKLLPVSTNFAWYLSVCTYFSFYFKSFVDVFNKFFGKFSVLILSCVVFYIFRRNSLNKFAWISNEYNKTSLFR